MRLALDLQSISPIQDRATRLLALIKEAVGSMKERLDLCTPQEAATAASSVVSTAFSVIPLLAAKDVSSLDEAIAELLKLSLSHPRCSDVDWLNSRGCIFENRSLLLSKQDQSSTSFLTATIDELRSLQLIHEAAMPITTDISSQFQSCITRATLLRARLAFLEKGSAATVASIKNGPDVSEGEATSYYLSLLDSAVEPSGLPRVAQAFSEVYSTVSDALVAFNTANTPEMVAASVAALAAAQAAAAAAQAAAQAALAASPKAKPKPAPKAKAPAMPAVLSPFDASGPAGKLFPIVHTALMLSAFRTSKSVELNALIQGLNKRSTNRWRWEPVLIDIDVLFSCSSTGERPIVPEGWKVLAELPSCVAPRCQCACPTPPLSQGSVMNVLTKHTEPETTTTISGMAVLIGQFSDRLFTPQAPPNMQPPERKYISNLRVVWGERPPKDRASCWLPLPTRLCPHREVSGFLVFDRITIGCDDLEVRNPPIKSISLEEKTSESTENLARSQYCRNPLSFSSQLIQVTPSWHQWPVVSKMSQLIESAQAVNVAFDAFNESRDSAIQQVKDAADPKSAPKAKPKPAPKGKGEPAAPPQPLPVLRMNLVVALDRFFNIVYKVVNGGPVSTRLVELWGGAVFCISQRVTYIAHSLTMRPIDVSVIPPNITNPTASPIVSPTASSSAIPTDSPTASPTTIPSSIPTIIDAPTGPVEFNAVSVCRFIGVCGSFLVDPSERRGFAPALTPIEHAAFLNSLGSLLLWVCNPVNGDPLQCECPSEVATVGYTMIGCISNWVSKNAVDVGSKAQELAAATAPPPAAPAASPAGSPKAKAKSAVPAGPPPIVLSPCQIFTQKLLTAFNQSVTLLAKLSVIVIQSELDTPVLPSSYSAFTQKITLSKQEAAVLTRLTRLHVIKGNAKTDTDKETNNWMRDFNEMSKINLYCHATLRRLSDPRDSAIALKQSLHSFNDFEKRLTRKPVTFAPALHVAPSSPTLTTSPPLIQSPSKASPMAAPQQPPQQAPPVALPPKNPLVQVTKELVLFVKERIKQHAEEKERQRNLAYKPRPVKENIQPNNLDEVKQSQDVEIEVAGDAVNGESMTTVEQAS